MPGDICSSDEYLYVTDIQNKTIYQILNSEIIKQYSSTGKAPGDIIYPQNIYCNNDTLFVLDAQLCRITAFDQNFKYLFSFKLNSACYSFVVDNKQNVYVSKYFGDSLIVKYDFHGNINNKFLNNKHSSYDAKNPLNNAINICIDERNKKLFYSYILKNYIGTINIKSEDIVDKKYFNVNLPEKEFKMKYEENRYFIESSGTIKCSDFKRHQNKTIILCGGGFEGNMGNFNKKRPIRNMKYYLLVVDKKNVEKFLINLPLESGMGYKFTILKDKIFFISMGKQKIYYTKKTNFYI